MNLKLMDFSNIRSNKDENKEEDKIENHLKQEVEILKKQIEDLLYQIEIEKEKSYKKGYEDAIKTEEEKFKKMLEEKIKEISYHYEQNYEDQLKQLKDQFENIKKDLKEKYQSYLSKVEELIHDVIVSILEFLYIEVDNPNYLAEKINEILEDLRDLKVLKIRVGKNQNIEEIKKILPDVMIEIDEKLEGNDFIIEFDKVKIENIFRDKVEILKNEIKREIRKLSEV